MTATKNQAMNTEFPSDSVLTGMVECMTGLFMLQDGRTMKNAGCAIADHKKYFILLSLLMARYTAWT
jgi:hypothetical protein